MRVTTVLFVIASLVFLSCSKETEDTDSWTTKSPMSVARCGLSACVLNGKIYAIGGTPSMYGIDPPFAIVEEYDPATNTWTKKAPMPTPRWGLGTSVVNGKIYAIGGLDTMLIIEEYDPATNTWTKKTKKDPMPTPRWGLATSVVNGKIYVIGGGPVNGKALAIVEEYDPTTDTWTTKKPMPTPRWGFFTSVVNDKIYAIGGVDWAFRPWIDIVEEYDPATDTWKRKTPMPNEGRCHLAGCELNGIIYAIGGCKEAEGPALKTVEAYDPETDTWSTDVPDMITGRWGLAACAVNQEIYAIGGAQGVKEKLRSFATVEAYTIH